MNFNVSHGMYKIPSHVNSIRLKNTTPSKNTTYEILDESMVYIVFMLHAGMQFHEFF
jgi:hypothetical protein